MKNLLKRKAGNGQDAGFTMVELLLVVIIIAVLAAIAVPIYLSQRQKAWDANAKSDLYNAAIAQTTYQSEVGSYTGNLADLAAKGFTGSNNVTVTIRESGADFCMEAFHNSDVARIWHVESGSGQPNPEMGACS